MNTKFPQSATSHFMKAFEGETFWSSFQLADILPAGSLGLPTDQQFQRSVNLRVTPSSYLLSCLSPLPPTDDGIFGELDWLDVCHLCRLEHGEGIAHATLGSRWSRMNSPCTFLKPLEYWDQVLPCVIRNSLLQMTVQMGHFQYSLHIFTYIFPDSLSLRSPI